MGDKVRIRAIYGGANAIQAIGIAQIVATGLLGAVLALTIRKHSPEIALLITLTTALLIFFMLMPWLAETVALLSQLNDMLGVSMPYISLVLKAIAVAYIAEIGSQVCQDAGEATVSAKIDMAGKLIIMVIAAPVLLDLVHIIMGLTL